MLQNIVLILYLYVVDKSHTYYFYLLVKVQNDQVHLVLICERNNLVRKMNCTVVLFRKSGKPNKWRVIKKQHIYI